MTVSIIAICLASLFLGSKVLIQIIYHPDEIQPLDCVTLIFLGVGLIYYGQGL